jgi:acyl carrier protein
MSAHVRAEATEDRVTRVLLEYAERAPTGGTLAPSLSLRRDLAIESLTLVSVMLRLGEELGVDVVEAGIELSGLETVADVLRVGRALSAKGTPANAPVNARRQ